MFLLLPSIALWLKLAYVNRRLHYTEHLAFALHVHSYWFPAFGLVFTDRWWLASISCTAVPWYTLVAMRSSSMAAGAGRAFCVRVWSACCIRWR